MVGAQGRGGWWSLIGGFDLGVGLLWGGEGRGSMLYA
jgi:hypothetical protein